MTGPDAEYAAGYGGAGIWSTAAFDETTNYLYAGSADSEGLQLQHPYNNAILKIDADPARSTFGSVVDGFTGTNEHYDLDEVVPGLTSNVLCQTDPAIVPAPDPSQSPACLELDLDFGASPNLYVDSNGRTVVTALQKSGVHHAVNTADMTAVWQKLLSVPDNVGNSATGATDGTNLYVGTSPNGLFSFERTSGSLNWMSNIGISALSYEPLTIANGVIYTITDLGHLVAFNAATGQMLLQRPLYLDAGVASCIGTGAGVAVARHTVYAACDAGAYMLQGTEGAIVAYRPTP